MLKLLPKSKRSRLIAAIILVILAGGGAWLAVSPDAATWVRAQWSRIVLQKTLFIEDPANGCTWSDGHIDTHSGVLGSEHPEVAVPNSQVQSYLDNAAKNSICTDQE